MFLKKQDAEPKLSDHNVIFYASTVTFLHPPPKKKNVAYSVTVQHCYN